MKATGLDVAGQPLLSQATYQEVARELTTTGQFEELLKSYCNGSAQAYTPAELETGKPWRDQGRVKFKIDGLINFLKNRNHPWAENRAKVGEEIKRINGDEEYYFRQNYKTADGGWGTVRVWSVPEIKDDDIDLPVKEIDTDVPF
jgi:hypothetical protein